MDINQRVMRMDRYKKAYVEVDAIIDTFDDMTRSRISPKFIEFIKSKKDPNYHFELDNTKSILDQKFMQETYNVISLIYRSYFCTPEERNFLAQKDREEIRKAEEERKAKYDTDLIFKQRLQAQEEARRKAEEQNVLMQNQQAQAMNVNTNNNINNGINNNINMNVNMNNNLNNNPNVNVNNNVNHMVEYKEPFFKRLFRKIANFFKGNR